MNDYNTSTAVENTNSCWFGFHEGIIHLQNWFITYIRLSGPVKYYFSLSNGRIIEHNSINLLTNSAKNRNVFQFNWVKKECAEPFFSLLAIRMLLKKNNRREKMLTNDMKWNCWQHKPFPPAIHFSTCTVFTVLVAFGSMWTNNSCNSKYS